MSVSKTASNLVQLQPQDDDLLIVQKAKDLSKDVNHLNNELLGTMNPIDAVALNIEEYTLLKEFRDSKLNYRLERVRTIRNKMKKMFEV